jgi:hypothetical protein
MEDIEKVVMILKAISVPVLVLVFIFLFKKDISKLLRSIVRLRWKEDIDIEFQREVDEIEDDAETSLPEIETIEDQKKTTEIDLRELVSVSPSWAILQSWVNVEKSAKALIERKGFSPDYDTSTPYKLIEECLTNDCMVDKKTGKIFRDLRLLRNKVAHASNFHISEQEANGFIELAIRLREKLDAE